MGLGLDLISKAAKAVGKEIAMYAAGDVLEVVEGKVDQVVTSATKKINQKTGMITESEFYSTVEYGRVLVINDSHVDTRSVYDSYNSSFNICYRDGTVRCTVKEKKKLKGIQFHIRSKETIDGKKQNEELGIVNKANGIRDRVSIRIFENHFADIWVNKEDKKKQIRCSLNEWKILQEESSFKYNIYLNDMKLATITKVMSDIDTMSKDKKHMLQIWNYDYEVQCIFIFVAVAILDNTSVFKEPHGLNTPMDAIFKHRDGL